MKIGIQIALAALAIFIAYLVWNSIDSKIVLTETVAKRNKVVQKRMEQIRDAQVEYKKLKGEYANSFDKLVGFLKNDSIIQVKMEGEVPDSLLGREQEALAMGIIRRDTTKIPVREELFKENFDAIVDSMMYIPFAGGKQFIIRAGELEKEKIKVKVFEVVAHFTDVYRGLNTDNEGYDMKDSLRIGSMEEPTTNGNWD
ncbi:MAG: hypothetical protein KDD41_05720 [Flavobacteriales bacterium]|nr:hypothetical protein [Flavobacteriales bacterium]